MHNSLSLEGDAASPARIGIAKVAMRSRALRYRPVDNAYAWKRHSIRDPALAVKCRNLPEKTAASRTGANDVPRLLIEQLPFR
ncbi:hypothetical protein [Cohnella faecalis]|uniref:Uncharacterized protein n=1 Tax=Cohnella faecalis TaxID=2315694 RepID=A0A398CKM2_9BACL|nr:hypothetical protein [Cohnella faecalis]RIE03856.1 hypothetical protein D3H35_09915 [Cohnella faecalis]